MIKIISQLPTRTKKEFFIKVEYDSNFYDLWAVVESTPHYKHITELRFDVSNKLKNSEKKAIKKLVTETLLN